MKKESTVLFFVPDGDTGELISVLTGDGLCADHVAHAIAMTAGWTDEFDVVVSQYRLGCVLLVDGENAKSEAFRGDPSPSALFEFMRNFQDALAHIFGAEAVVDAVQFGMQQQGIGGIAILRAPEDAPSRPVSNNN